jgi:N-acetylmuramoyl-L-alanine amidase
VVIKTTPEQTKLLARLMRAEAEGDGQEGMLMVGNTGVNRVLAECLDFRDITTIEQMVFQSPGGFEATKKPYFYQQARTQDIKLAKRVLAGQRYYPATYALWFYRPVKTCKKNWFGQQFSGKYKNHCFYKPTQKNCPSIYSV